VADIVIKRCPVCPSVRSRVEDITTALRDDLHVSARVADGAMGELSVFVDGVPVIQRAGDDLPTYDEVEAAVRNATAAGA
jgi:hypothetical protein